MIGPAAREAARTAPSIEIERRTLLERALSQGPGRPVAIAEVRGHAAASATSWRAEVLTLHLADGGELRVFLKDFGAAGLPKDRAGERAERERSVYRDLLAGAGLGTPELLGEVWSEGRRWLLLEHVEARDLRSFGMPMWVEAAAWLGRLQARFAPRADRIEACPALVRHDESYFISLAERARRAVGEHSPALASKLEAALEGYGDLVEVMVRQPRTLVHGSYRRQNILVGAGSPLRVFPVDWELAALGGTLYDLAFLAEGFRPPDLDALTGAWRREAERGGAALPAPRELPFVLDCFRLAKVVKSLGDCVALRFPPEAVERYLAMAEELRGQVA